MEALEELLSRTLERKTSASTGTARSTTPSEKNALGDHGRELYHTGILGPILDSLAEALIIARSDGKVMLYNRAATELFGSATLNALFSHWPADCRVFEIDQITPVKNRNCPLVRAGAGESLDNVQMFMVNPAHPKGVFVEASARPLRNGEGSVYGAALLLRDITERKRAEERLRSSQAHFETLAHVVNDVLWDWDLTTQKVWRECSGKQMGYDRELMSADSEWWLEKVHPDDREKICAGLERLTSGQVSEYCAEYRFRRADGGYAYVLDRGTVLERDDAGKPTRIIGAMLDISERRATEEKLARLAAIVESSTDAIVSADAHGKIVSWNRGAEQLYGFTEGETVGKMASEIFPDYEVEGTGPLFRQTVEGGSRIDTYEMWRTRKNGERVRVSMSLFPVRNAEGEITGGCGISRDVTELRLAHEEIQHLAQRLAHSNQELQRFAYVASHDLQEPLRMVGSYVKLVSQRFGAALDDDGKQFIQFATDGVLRMQNLIEALLEYSRVEQSGPNFSEVDCERLVGEVLRTLGWVIRDTHANIEVGPLPTIRGDRVRLGQLFQNLLSNAIKFRGPRNPEVKVSAVKGLKSEWLFLIEDRGIGIDPQHSSKLFEVFQRLHRKEEYPGTGLGLAICKKIVEQHGGAIWFHSVPTKGSTFYFTLPA